MPGFIVHCFWLTNWLVARCHSLCQSAVDVDDIMKQAAGGMNIQSIQSKTLFGDYKTIAVSEKNGPVMSSFIVIS
jgi:hypothetical protein